MDIHLREFHKRLVAFTKGARPDFHEPDEQGFSAVVHGDNLDNAMGDNPADNCQEMTVELRRDTNDGVVVEYFNLASLIALAREAR